MPHYYKDVPTTLVHLLDDLDAWLQPKCPWELPLVYESSVLLGTRDGDRTWASLKLSRRSVGSA